MTNLKCRISKKHYGTEKVNRFLKLLAFFYEAVTNFRIFLYEKNILKSYSVNAKVVSIGNLTTGGSGKTPITSKVANYFQNTLGNKTAIISRGYGGKLSTKNTNIISDGEKIFYDAVEAGDEPYWLAKNSPNVVVITGKDRVKSANLALEKFGCKIIILDDGYQHLRLRRDVDIVAIDGRKGFGNAYSLPAGPLREKNIDRANLIVIVDKEPWNRERLFNPATTVETHHCSFSYKKICNSKADLIPQGQKIVALTSIAQPEPFISYLKNCGFNIIKEEIFSDHHQYTKEELEKITNYSCDAIVTTEKDIVKIEAILEDTKCFYAVKLDVECGDFLRVVSKKLFPLQMKS